MVEALRAGNVDTRDPAAVLNAAGDLARAMQRTVWRRVGLSVLGPEERDGSGAGEAVRAWAGDRRHRAQDSVASD